MRTRKRPLQYCLGLSLLLLLTGSVNDVQSQSGRGVGWDTGTVNAPPMLRLWNWPDTLFLLGAYDGPLAPESGKAEDMWPFMESLGLYFLLDGETFNSNIAGDSLRWLRYFDTLSWSADMSKHQRVTSQQLNAYGTQLSHARAIEFYPFDSVQSPFYPYRFMSTDDTVYGQSRMNKDGIPGDTTELREQFYNTTNTTANTVISEHIVFNQWDDELTMTHRWPSETSDGTFEHAYNTDRWILDDKAVNDDGIEGGEDFDSIYFLVITGHLFNGGASNLSDSLLKLEIIYEVPKYDSSKGVKLLFHPGDSALTAESLADTTFLITTLYVTKSDLFPTGPPPANWDEYREAILPLDMRYLANGAWGPTHPSSAGEISRRFDIKVTWLGGEQLALRSVALRSIHGQLVFGKDAAAQQWRQQRIDFMRRLLYGTFDASAPDDSLRRSWFGIHPTEEQYVTGFAGLEYMTRMLRDTFNVPRPGSTTGERDSVGIFSAQTFNADFFHHHHLTTPKTVVAETYYLTFFEAHDEPQKHKGWYDLRYGEVPSIREENGGRFGLDEIDLDDPTSVEEYTKTLQQRIIGRYLPSWDSIQDKYQKRHGLLHRIGLCARISRATGRRFIQMPSVNANLDFRISRTGSDPWYLDTLVTHIPTESELKTLTNLGLCYGAKGAVYWWLGALNDYLPHNQANGSTQIYGTSVYQDGKRITDESHLGGGFGPIGGATKRAYTNDTTFDTGDYNFYIGSDTGVKIIIPNFYGGFKTRSTAMKRVNARLKEIGRVMMDLTWREGYSVHQTVQTPISGSMIDFKFRPFNPDDIVTGVRAWDPRTKVYDSLHKTYVEIGLFDKKAGLTPMLDTNYIFVVNRRTFERPDHVNANSMRGRKMDSLTENRTIELTLRLPSPDTSEQYTHFVRVREIVPTYDTLVLLGVRKPLDTVVDSYTGKVRVTLPPGGATLLQTVFLPADESMVAGLLTRNNQRKCLYDPVTQHYMATYHRFDSNANDWHVYLRRSVPMQNLGAILWEPMEYWISGTSGPIDPILLENSHPSLTYRRIGDSAIIASVVWTAHPYSTAHSTAGEREIVLREILFQDYYDSVNSLPVSNVIWMLNKKTVGYHKGQDPEEWGTPVISSSSSDSGIGEYIAWSDSTAGIVACGLLYNADVSDNVSWTPYDTLSTYYNLQSSNGFGKGQFPAMPPFTHRALHQQSAPIVWQQPDNSQGSYIGIVYGRLDYVPPATGPKLQFSLPLTMLNPPFYISPFPGDGTGYQDLGWNRQYRHPSIDQSQDALGRVMEGVTWERHYYTQVYVNGVWAYDNYITDIHYRSLLFDTATNQPMLEGAWISKPNQTAGYNPGYGFPVISSQNQVLNLADSTAIPLFSIVFMRPNPDYDMYQVEAKWRMNMDPQWSYQTAKGYNHGGYTPNGAASVGKLDNRYAALYVRASDSSMRTTREYYAKSHPEGYEADGREVGAQLQYINDTVPVGFVARLYDVWISDDEKSVGIRMVEDPSPDSVSDVIAQLRTESFSTGDSVAIGGTMFVEFFYGDSVAATGKSIEFTMELIDSATGDVVYLLDSTCLGVTSDPTQYRITDTIIDILSGTYYVQLKLHSTDTGLFTNFPLDSTTRWTTGRVQNWVESLTGKRVRKLDGEAGNGLRISAQPNSTTGETEFRFSVSRKEHVSLTVYDAMGREVARLVEKELFSSGRYAVEFDGSTLKPGTYMVELKTLNGRVTEKVVVKR